MENLFNRLKEKLAVWQGQSTFKKGVVYGLTTLVIFMVARELLFWSLFNSVMGEVKNQTEAVKQRQADILSQAQKMQARMDDKLNNFQSSMQKQESKMQHSVDDFNSGAVKAERMFPGQGEDEALEDKINNRIMNDVEEETRADNMRRDLAAQQDKSQKYFDVFSDDNNPKKYFELSPDEQQVVLKLIAAYKAAHPQLMKIPGAATPLKLSLQDKVALIEMIRAYNNKILHKEAWKAGATDRQILKETSPEAFDRARQNFNKAFQDTLTEFHEEDQKMAKELS